MRQPVRRTYDPGPEVATRLRWVCGRLLGWFAREGRSFPWRDPGRAPYEVVVAEMLLQRTTAAAVAHAYADFLARYPDWDTLAHAPQDGLEAALRPLLLQSKEEQAIFFPWTIRHQETFRIDKRVNLIVGKGATATLLFTRIGPHPAEQHHEWQREPHGVCLPG